MCSLIHQIEFDLVDSTIQPYNNQIDSVFGETMTLLVVSVQTSVLT